MTRRPATGTPAENRSGAGTGAPLSGSEGRASPSRGVCLVAWALLALAWLSFAYPMFTGKVHFPTDIAAVNSSPPDPQPTVTSNPVDTDAAFLLYPWHVYFGEQLRAGHLPLWDPTRFAGAPLAADLPVGALYPPNWLYALGHFEVIWTLIWAATLAASLALTYWFLRVVRLHPLAAALGAITWTFGGFMVSYGMFDAYLGSALWLPMALGGLELARRGRPRWGVPVAGLALALSVLAGHSQITLYVWLAAAIWVGVSTLAAAATARSRGRGAVVRELLRGAGMAAAAFGIAAGLASAEILGALQYTGEIVRQNETYAQATALHLSLHNLPTMFIPDYLGQPTSGNYYAWPGLSIETTFYVGILALPLAVASLFHRDRRLVWTLIGLAALGGVAAFATPAYHLVYALLPGFARTRVVSRFRLLVDFGLAGLAAFGLDAVLEGRPGARRAALAATAAAAVALAVLMVSRQGTPLPASYLTPRGLREGGILLAAGAGVWLIARFPARATVVATVLVGLAGADLWMAGFSYHPFQPSRPLPPSPVLKYLSTVAGPRPRYVQTGPSDGFVLLPNASEVYGLYALNGYDAFIPRDYVEMLSILDSQITADAINNEVFPLHVGGTEPPILDLLGARDVVSGSTPAPGTLADQASLAVVGPVSVYRQASAFPPGFVVGCWQIKADGAAAAQLKGMGDAGLRSSVVVAPQSVNASLGAPAEDCSGPDPTPGPAAAVRQYQAEKVVLSVPASSQGGIVVLTDEYSPGWTALVDGKPAPILRVDLALRGVAVGPGAHTITFAYRPRWPEEGLAITVVTILVIAAWATLGHHTRRVAPIDNIM